MPDHWHALFAFYEPWTLPKFMHDFMSDVGRKTGRFLSTHDTSWQDGYYDTHVKTPKQWDASSARCREMITDPWPLIYD